jgi:hypothetical protein
MVYEREGFAVLDPVTARPTGADVAGQRPQLAGLQVARRAVLELPS